MDTGSTSGTGGGTSPSPQAPSEGIWNPNAACNWSLLFTPAFGAYVQALNWASLSEPRKARSARVWFYISIGVLLLYLLVPADAVGILPLPYLLIWYLAAGRPQVAYVKQKYGASYKRKGWGRPLSIALASVVGYYGLAVVVALLPSWTPSGRTRLSTSAVAQQALPATVTIVTFDASHDTIAQGSGFVLRSDGTIVTNWHVLAGASSATVVLASGEQFGRVGFIDGDSTADIAIIRIPGYGLPVLAPRADNPAIGDHVVVTGTPLGLSNTVSEGIVSGTRLFEGREFVQITAPISHGSSGGPVLDDQGHVFAVATSYLRGGQQLNFAVPIRYALGLLGRRAPERRLADVFSHTANRRQSTAARPSPARRHAPSPTSQPRVDATGAYFVEQAYRGNGARTSYLNDLKVTGLLLIGHHDLGWMLLSTNVKDPKDRFVYSVFTFTQTPDGRVLLAVGPYAYDGYQTDDGLYGQGSITVSGRQAGMAFLTATATAIPLSDQTGLYDLSTRTDFYTEAGERVGDATTDWTGEAAVAFALDSVFIDLFLENASGGNVAATFRTPLKADESFSATSTSKASLTGSFAAGRFDASWIDERTNGSFRGELTGRRK